ncbi:MAG: hypothetical protein E6J73_13630 [Deltaproteobacteria bacterium]|nr:MAG: hypothetical protein E6J73_13630 [Deltaproteobacteria bacterium]
MKVKIVESLCIACGLCREVCPEHAVHPKMQDIHHMSKCWSMNAPAAAIFCPTARSPARSKNTRRLGLPADSFLGSDSVA